MLFLHSLQLQYFSRRPPSKSMLIAGVGPSQCVEGFLKQRRFSRRQRTVGRGTGGGVWHHGACLVMKAIPASRARRAGWRMRADSTSQGPQMLKRGGVPKGLLSYFMRRRKRLLC